MISKKLSFVFGVALSVSLTQAAFADCKESYSNQIKRLDGMMNPPRGILAGNIVGGAIVPVALIAGGVTVTVGSVVALPAAAVGAGTYLGVLAGLKKSYQNALTLIKNSEKGKGKQLARMTKKLAKKDSKITQEMVAREVLLGNQSNAFCKENDNGKMKIVPFQGIKKHLASTLGVK